MATFPDLIDTPSHAVPVEPVNFKTPDKQELMDSFVNASRNWPEEQLVLFVDELQQIVQERILLRLDEAAQRHEYMRATLDSFREITGRKEEVLFPPTAK